MLFLLLRVGVHRWMLRAGSHIFCFLSFFFYFLCHTLFLFSFPFVSRFSFLVPDFEEAVPGPGADGHAVLGDAEAAHAVVVAGEHAWKEQREGRGTAQKLRTCLRARSALEGGIP